MHLLLAVFLLLACSDSTDPGNGNGNGGTPLQLAAVEVVNGLNRPVHLTAPVGDARLFVVEQPGRIRIVQDGQLLPTPFLDIDSIVRSTGNEQGLFSLAFHPQYAANGFFYVNFTNENGDTRVARYTVTGNSNVADPGSRKVILAIDQPFGNHNGGQIAFGPDGMLYVGMGDGGSGGDPLGHGQNLNTLLGALLRIDVDGGDPYAVPGDNPFGDEIWGFGLRNPWRFSFDAPSAMIYIGDVGQNAWEEVNVAPANSAARNYGWNVMEGNGCFGGGSCNQTGMTLPVIVYPTGSEGCSVIGGYVYRGAALPDVIGHYFYSDWCNGWLRSFKYVGGAATEQTEWNVGDIGNVLSFGVDANGELYILSQNGRVYRLVQAS
ncbi:MAG: PQQ-dependent sugar dehydrogenase [Gemmatimonadales bacterium]